MAQIRKGDPVSVPDSTESMVASRDEYNSRVWVMTEREYRLQTQGGARGKEEPYLILPDRTLVRDYQHGFPDEIG
ncbi:MAG TPA: hypothetical protein VHB50_07835 [Bryobacteraceae bacterium]|jgi:hypothetical protein|nr:hypothetical protein [Bryobacteraceae bacterium]